MAPPAGYSGTPLPKKLGITAGTLFATKHAATDFDESLGELPPDARRRRQVRPGLHLVIGF